jgi:hypothetical protein
MTQPEVRFAAATMRFFRLSRDSTGDRQVGRSPAEKRSEFRSLEEVALLGLDMPKRFVRRHCFRETS